MPKRSKPHIDHLGKRYPSAAAMCKAWDISYTAYHQRCKRGYTIEEALTGKKPRAGKPCTDHTGQEFPSIVAMCKAWKVKLVTYNYRLRIGWSLEEALTGKHGTKDGKKKPCTDHMGQSFPSIKAMCDYWGVNRHTFSARRKRGWSLEETLTGKRTCTDHTGREFPSQKAMCEAWGIARTTYNDRLRIGWTLEEALTGNKAHGNTKPCTDHSGQHFPSMKAMCKHWGVKPDTFLARLKRGWTQEEALTGRRG